MAQQIYVPIYQKNDNVLLNPNRSLPENGITFTFPTDGFFAEPAYILVNNVQMNAVIKVIPSALNQPFDSYYTTLTVQQINSLSNGSETGLLSFPTVQDDIQYINNTTLGSFSVTYLPIYSSEIIFPNATTATIIEFGGDNKLDYTTRLSFPNLVSVTNRIYVYGGNNGSALTSFEVPSLTTCGYLEITNCPDLVTLDLSSLTTAPEFAISYNSSLTTIDLSGLTTINSTTNYSFQYNALNEATVNAILVKFADIQPTGTGEIYLDGGTSAAPTGAGATAKTTLESGGWTVFTN